MYIEVDKAGFSLSTYICLAEYLLCYRYKYLRKPRNVCLIHMGGFVLCNIGLALF